MKLFGFALVVLAVCSLALTISADSGSNETSGKYIDCGKSVSCFLQNGTLAVNGKGEILDYTLRWRSCASEVKRIQIYEGVTSIAALTFSELPSLTVVEIPASVSWIGEEAFAKCPELNSIFVDENNHYFQSIDGVLFDYNITKILQYPVAAPKKTYRIPDTVTSISNKAFYWSGFVKVTIPASVLSIKEYAFSWCKSLEYFIVDAANPNYQSVDGVLFSKDGKTLINYPIGNLSDTYLVPENVTSLGVDAFAGGGRLVNITLPKSLKIIGDYSFNDCDGLKTVVIPEGVEWIGMKAFLSCNLAYITIPESVTFFGSEIFSEGSVHYVFYQGSQEISNSLFYASALDTICVSPDYKGLSFGGKDVSNATICQEFQGNFSRCFKAVYTDEGFIVKKRTNSSWDNRFDGCMEYHCYDESEPVVWSLCNSTSEDSFICVDNECVDKKSMENKTAVQIDLDEQTSVSEINKNVITDVIAEQYGIDPTLLVVGTEVDKEGYIVRVFIYVDEEATAYSISDRMNDCI